jgi:hypothetical protein
MDPVRVIVATTAAAVLAVVAWSDWRTRSARSFGLLVVAVTVAAVSGLGDWEPWPLGWAVAVGILAPVAFHPPWLAPLEPADHATVERLGAIGRALVRESNRYRKNELPESQLHDKFAEIRQRAALIRAPDDEWREVLTLVLADIDASVAELGGQQPRSEEAIRDEHRRFRAIYSGLVKRRSRFWR